MHGAGRFPINLYLGVGHSPFKNKLYRLIFPVRIRNECMLIIANFIFLEIFLPAIVIGTKALGFPVGWYRYFTPGPAIGTTAHHKIPIYGMVFIDTRKIANLCGLTTDDAYCYEMQQVHDPLRCIFDTSFLDHGVFLLPSRILLHVLGFVFRSVYISNILV